MLQLNIELHQITKNLILTIRGTERPITGIRDFVIKLYLDSRCNYLMLDGLGLQDFISTEIRNGTPLFYTLQICFFNVLSYEIDLCELSSTYSI